MNPFLKKFLNKLQGSSIESDLKSYQNILTKIDDNNFKAYEDSFLRKKSKQLINQARAGVPLDSLFIEAFVLVREAARRTIGLLPHDVQIIGAIALHQGKLIEMNTGLISKGIKNVVGSG